MNARPAVRGFVGVAALCWFLVPTGSRAEEFVPVPVSPAQSAGDLSLVEPCATFSWSGIADARGYRVQIVVKGVGEETETLFEADVASGRSWTAPSCLEEGREYAWRVGALASGASGASGASEVWSPLVHFRVSGGHSLQAALRQAADRLVADGVLSETERDQLREILGYRQIGDTTTHDSESLASMPVGAFPPPPALHSVGDASAHVESDISYGVVAVGKSFGVYAEAFDPAGAVAGKATAPSGQNRGVTGHNRTSLDAGAGPDAAARGVLGTGTAIGVTGTTIAPAGQGVTGKSTFRFGFSRGVVGEAASTAGKGVEGRATATTHTNYGVWSKADSTGAAGFDFYAAGSGTDYGPFTGAHVVRLAAGSGVIRPGMVVSVTGEVAVPAAEDGSASLSATLPTIRLAAQPDDPAVLGAFVGELEGALQATWFAGDNHRLGAVNALGEGRIWVSDVTGPVAAGDYLTTSAIPGYAQRQTDSVLRAHTVAKAIEAIDWRGISETVVHEGRAVKVALVGVVYTGG